MHPIPLDDPTDAPSLKRWRKALRTELIAHRTSATSNDHARWSNAIDAHLRSFFDSRDIAGRAIAFCWPYNAEYDARGTIAYLLSRGARAALPVVVAPRTPLAFHEWSADTPMGPDVYGIPIPLGTRQLVPDVALVALNGFDEQGFRLGYGAGYFDRTLAALGTRPLTLGVGFELGRLPTIHPQPHDIPMDLIVTEVGVQRCLNGKLVVATTADARS